MALIKCPECGTMVSDKARTCPQCAYPIAEEKNRGKVWVKFGLVAGGNAFKNKQKAILRESSTGRTLWTGDVGSIIELRIEKPTSINVEYCMSMLYYGGSCTGIIDPTKGNRYAVHARQGAFKMVLTFQMVDMIDAD